MIRLLLGLAATLALAGAARAAPATYAPGPCAADFTGVAQRLECATLTVDETRGSTSGRRVAMPVVVVKALHPRAGAPPVIFLHGGPGGGVVGRLPQLLRGEVGRELVGQDQDWVFFDQRGGVLSSPVLDCGQVAFNDNGPLNPAALESLKACGARHVAAGVDLSRYNAAEVARDVQDLRRALHYDRFDLFGVSYGTRIGFAVLTHAPQGVRAVVLDSVWPPEATWAEGGPQMVSSAVKLIFARCAADAACHAAFPDPAAALGGFASMLLNARSVTLHGRTYTPDDLGGFLMDTIYDAEGARALPRDAYALARGDTTALDAQMADRSPYVEAQHLTHLCKEEFPFEHRDRVAAGTAGDPVAKVTVASFERYFDACKAFPVGPADPVEQAPVSSPVPTLFLSAEIDPGCPPPLAEAAEKRFANGRFVLIPNTTHGVFRGSACARRMIRAYLADPSRPLDTTCLHPEHDRFAFALK